MKFWRSPILWAAAFFLLTLLVAALSPLEKVLGVSARLVYLHGAWVWTALLAIALAAAAGLAGLISRRPFLQSWSRALGRAGLAFLIVSLPLSLYMMQANWNGLFMDEPRWRVPFTFAVAGLLLQIGLSLMKPVWAAAANLVYAAALAAAMRGMVSVLHPDSPIFNSGAVDIQVFFIALLALLILAAWQVTRWFLRFEHLAPAI